MKKIAWIVTKKEKVYDEIAVFSAMLKNQHNITVELVSWLDDDDKNLDEFDLIIINGCDGYHQHFEKFTAWLTKQELLAKKIFNPLPAIRWNIEKTYLEELDNAGFMIPETIWVKKKEEIPFEKLLRKDWQKIIFKPTISAGSSNTFILTIDEVKKQKTDLAAKLKPVLKKSGLILQEFMEKEIAEGEFSFLFFDKKFSHAVKKVPAKNDFRAGIRQGARVSSLKINSESAKKLLTSCLLI